jgi:hypothetical protein
MFGDDVWIADSTPVECGRSRETAKRSDLAGFAEYGYCASHSRYFWGLRLHLLCTLHGLPIAAAVTGAKADERHVLLGMLDDADLAHQIAGTTLIADKNYYGRDFETTLTAAGIDLLRPTRKGRKDPPGWTILQTTASICRIGVRHLQRPARPGTARRTNIIRRTHPHLATHPRAHRRDLAQRQHWRTHQTLTDRLRPLTPWNQSSSEASPLTAEVAGWVEW